MRVHLERAEADSSPLFEFRSMAGRVTPGLLGRVERGLLPLSGRFCRALLQLITSVNDNFAAIRSNLEQQALDTVLQAMTTFWSTLQQITTTRTTAGTTSATAVTAGTALATPATTGTTADTTGTLAAQAATFNFLSTAPQVILTAID